MNGNSATRFRVHMRKYSRGPNSKGREVRLQIYESQNDANISSNPLLRKACGRLLSVLADRTLYTRVSKVDEEAVVEQCNQSQRAATMTQHLAVGSSIDAPPNTEFQSARTL